MLPVYLVEACKFEIEQLNDFLFVIKDMLQDYEQKLEDWYSVEDLENMTREEELQYERYIDRFSNVVHDFPGRLYGSFIVSWYSFIEDSLIQLCRDMALKITVDVDNQGRFDTGIRRARKFLEEGAGCVTDTKHWQELLAVSQVRNLIVHNRGILKFSIGKRKFKQSIEVIRDDIKYHLYINKAIHNHLEKHALLGFSKNIFYIEPTYEYCQYLIEFATGFFDKLFRDLSLT